MNNRKIALLIVSIILISLIPLNTFSLEGQVPSFRGIGFANTFLSNISFNDIRGHWAEEPIQFVSALSLMKGSGNNSFRPEAALTHAQAITVIVNSLGLEAEAQRLGENQAPQKVRDIIVLNAVSNWYKGYVQVASQQGILTPQEVNRIINLSQRELDAIENRVQNQMDGYLGRELDANEAAALERQVQDLVQTEAAWGKPVSRQQVALWMARALNLEPVYGDKIVLVYSLRDWREIDTDAIPLVEAVLQKGLMQGSGGLFRPRGNLTRAHMAQILYNTHEDLLDNLGLTKNIGRVVNIQNLQEGSSQRRSITLRNEDGTQAILELNAGSRDIIIQKNNRLGLSTTLSSGDYISYFINRNNEAVFAQAEKEIRVQISGDIEDINPEDFELTILDFNNRRHRLKGSVNTRVTINGKDTSFSDLLIGQEVEVTTLNGRPIEIKGFLEEDPARHGYIPPGTRTKVGTVLFLRANEIEIRTAAGREKYEITSSTQVRRGNRTANLFEIKTGDRVHLSFDNIYDPEVSIVRVEDEERHIEGIYKATLEHVNTRNGDVTINQISKYEQGSWVPLSQYKLTMGGRDAGIFKGAASLNINDLSRELGREVYIAAENSFNSLKAARILVKDGSIMTYHSPIASVSYGTNQLILDFNQLTYHAGTIVVKNNRLVDTLNLEIGQTIFAAVDQRLNNRNLSLAVITDASTLDPRPDSTRLAIYRGSIESIREGQITIDRLSFFQNYLKLNNHRWTEATVKKSFILTEDTLILDSDLMQQINSRFFMDTRFINPNLIIDPTLRERILNNYYINKPAYFVVRETISNGRVFEELIALNITQGLNPSLHGVQLDHIATGTISQVDIMRKAITLNNVQNLNNLNNRWEFGVQNQAVNLEKAIILLNDQPLLASELYRVRPRGTAYVLKIKEDSLGDTAYIIIIEQ